ncbi:putative mitochondrial RNA binding complex 1 subunit [Trypanosoma conorhini]|uniref:Putative mitochondrial RNA binding complex 1 subunit n=1 Tax=Trypanosoma conorhini TaxID=83891 RepID=A0A422QC57_9TRYP|nr:putative mitochondrial RNA binding complex 1 subunit [Trypanosoma conorhini]RNF27519.1 putative mitochondrial RNA binding complex 1 subunit [Trypanosoma conorhini]
MAALLEVCHRPAYGVRQQLACFTFATASSRTLALRNTGAAAFQTPLNHHPRRLHFSSLLRITAGTPATPEKSSSSSASNTTTESGVTALDVAMRVNKLKRLHQTGGGPDGKKRIELDAWSELNSLTEEQINSAEGKAVSLLLNSWAYFAKYWEKGKDGPLGMPAPAAAAANSPPSAAAASEDVPQDSRK